MRNCFALSAANWTLLFCLIAACGCQSEVASTDQVQPDRISESTPVKARQLNASEEVALDELASKGSSLFDAEQVNWEETVSQDSEKPNMDELLNLESTELGKLSGEASEKQSFLK